MFLIEHDPAVRDSLAISLGAAGLRVRTYDSVGAFLGDLEPADSACLVLDLDMPEPGGRALFQRFDERRAGLPTIATSGHLAAARQHPLLPAPYPLLQKPFGDVELLALIDRTVAEAATSGKPAQDGKPT